MVLETMRYTTYLLHREYNEKRLEELAELIKGSSTFISSIKIVRWSANVDRWNMYAVAKICAGFQPTRMFFVSVSFNRLLVDAIQWSFIRHLSFETCTRIEMPLAAVSHSLETLDLDNSIFTTSCTKLPQLSIQSLSIIGSSTGRSIIPVFESFDRAALRQLDILGNFRNSFLLCEGTTPLSFLNRIRVGGPGSFGEYFIIIAVYPDLE